MGLEKVRKFRRLSPSMYSMAMKYAPSSSPKSKTCTMFGWLSWAASRASSRNICTKRTSSMNCGRMRLITTCLENPAGPSARARNTSAIPPRASNLSTV
ncbi:MAG: hypothetical protein QM765_29370 [Myxococcales bacterium]